MITMMLMMIMMMIMMMLIMMMLIMMIMIMMMMMMIMMMMMMILGVQLFGDLHNHCVRECVDTPEDVTINDLTIPDTYCKIEREEKYGYECPRYEEEKKTCQDFYNTNTFFLKSEFDIYFIFPFTN